jgi:hypothetical protein
MRPGDARSCGYIPGDCGQGMDTVYFTPGVDELSDNCENRNDPPE